MTCAFHDDDDSTDDDDDVGGGGYCCYLFVIRSHKMVYKSILGATEILIYSERGKNADYYGEKVVVVSVKIKKLWLVKVSGGESSHFEKNQFKVVQHILGMFS